MFLQLRKPPACGRLSCPDVPEGADYCGNCTTGWLEDAQRSSSAALLRRALDTDFALRQRVSVRMADIPFDEWEALKIIETERTKFQREEEARNRKP